MNFRVSRFICEFPIHELVDRSVEGCLIRKFVRVPAVWDDLEVSFEVSSAECVVAECVAECVAFLRHEGFFEASVGFDEGVYLSYRANLVEQVLSQND